MNTTLEEQTFKSEDCMLGTKLCHSYSGLSVQAVMSCLPLLPFLSPHTWYRTARWGWVHFWL